MGAALPWVLAGCWGVLVTVPLVAFVRRRSATVRVVGLAARSQAPERPRSRRRDRGGSSALAVLAARTGAVGRVARGIREARARRRRDAELRRTVPIAVDLVGLAVGAGATPFLAVCVAAEWTPAPVATPLARVERACRLGTRFADAMAQLGVESAPLSGLAETLVASDRLGAPAGPALARLAAEAWTDVRRRAEARARALPVRLLFPLVFLVLPAFGLLTVAPALLAGLART